MVMHVLVTMEIGGMIMVMRMQLFMIGRIVARRIDNDGLRALGASAGTTHRLSPLRES
jgi:hypothetical protein